jgi:DNA-binding NarL/FixJ family response regulator
MIKILIADDHAIVRGGLKQILSETSDMVVVAEAADGQEVLEEVRKYDLDLVLLDIAAGVSGYLTKESAPEELISAIRKVSQGGKYVSSSLAEKLAFHLEADAERPLHEMLSDREYQVVIMIASGKTVKEIADDLSLSVKTISTNRARALKKMGMKNNAEITYYAIKQGLVT